MDCFLVLTLLQALLAVATPTRPPPREFNWTATKSVIAFGDSYSFVLGDHGRSNFSFIGDAHNMEFNASTLLTNRIIQNQTGTANGGPNWIEYLTGCGVKSGFTAPATCEKQLWNFAFAGAGISEEFLPLHHDYTISYVNQVKQFTTYAWPALKDVMEAKTSLVAVWIGINDVIDTRDHDIQNGTNLLEFYSKITAQVFASLEPIYELGFRNYLFLTLPPLELNSVNQKLTNPKPNVTMVEWYNNALKQNMRSFAANHTGTEAYLFDAEETLREVFRRPEEFGIKNTTDICPGYNQRDILWNFAKYGCSALWDYFWYDAGHMTSHAHKILADAVDKYLREIGTYGFIRAIQDTA